METNRTEINSCPICFEPLDHQHDFCITQCDHAFHTSCLFRAYNNGLNCPLCRHVIGLSKTAASAQPAPIFSPISEQNRFSQFTNYVRCILCIDLLETDRRKITRVSWYRPLEVYMYDDDDDESYNLRAVTTAEMQGVGYFGNSYYLTGCNGITKQYTTENTHFTVEEVFNNVLDFEISDRPHAEWFGGIDRHHCFFEGFSGPDADGKYTISWGS